ncbi:MAG: lactate utilization protein [Bacteroidales bacterium]|nr:lactate utilization protein [Bacteroidales bacterium]
MSTKPITYTDFVRSTEKVAFDREHRKKINYNISKYDAAVKNGKRQFSNLDLAKKKAAVIKYKVINELDRYLVEFEKNFEERGGKVIWALDAETAVKEVLNIAKKHKTKMVVKSKSMVTEEIELNKHLAKNKIEVVETDLGEFIVQQLGQAPYHIVTPAMHLSKEDVAKLFHEKFEMPENSSPEQITHFVRKLLREKFSQAEIGITGANFLIADTGSIAVNENEGNGMMTMSGPKIHIAITGIEKVIPSITDLDLFWPLLSTHGTGQRLSAYCSVINGPRQQNEADGPEAMYVILIDNGRTNLLAQPNQRRALTCIRCGACLNACPVYKNIGGHAYGTTYSGPIGAVIAPYMLDFEKFKHLSFASSLCGNCTEVCPVNINLHELLLHNRNDSVKRNTSTFYDKISMLVMKRFMMKRSRIDGASAGFKNKILRRFFKKAWGSRRQMPVVQPKSFRQLWEERQQ